ncbi:DNA topoisomerase [Myroides sp. LJL115]
MKKVKNAKFASVLEVRSKEHTQKPPMLFNMRTLQIEAGKRIGYNAWRTNFLTMALYQKRYLTYPRVAGNQIRESTYKQLPMLLDVHRKHKKYKDHIRWIQCAPITKRLVGDLSQMEHEGIFITPRYQHFLTLGQSKLVDLIMERIVQSLSDDCQRELTSIKVEIAGEVFTGHLSKIKQAG